MSDYLLSLVLGIVEGLTEFLPVSSTAHLRITEALFHLSLSNGYWKMYTIVIQLGAILCLPVYFRSRIAKFLSTFPHGERGDRTVWNHPLSLTMIAFVVTAIPAFLLTKTIGKHLEDLNVIGISLLVGGVVMWLVDARNAKSESGGTRSAGKPNPCLAHGGHVSWPSDLDWRLPDSFGGFSRHFAFHVDHRCRTVGRDVAGVGAGILVLSFDSHHGGRDLLQSAEIAERKRRESDRSFPD